jgi:DNA-binding FrmR family transcriptional regulator
MLSPWIGKFMTAHTSRPNIVNRLRKAEGHLRGIVAMLEAGRGCLELAQQLQAVEKAIANAKKELVHDHLDHCLDLAVGVDAKKSKASVKEFKEITKYL